MRYIIFATTNQYRLATIFLFTILVMARIILKVVDPSVQSMVVAGTDISERELDSILSELCAAKGPKVTFVSDYCYSPPLRDVYGLDHMLKLAIDNPLWRPNVDIPSENW